MSDAVTPWTLRIPQADLDDLVARLNRVRWPERETGEGWSQGVPLARAQALVEYWRTSYDWRRCEAMLNGFGQFRTVIDGLDLHFLHVRSSNPDAAPLLITHGWPGSVLEFHKVIGPLTEPQRYGGRAEDAFHVVAPSLPGYGLSGKPIAPGWNIPRIATTWHALMQRLGYTRYFAQGGDWGAAVTGELARLKPAGLAAVHMNIVAAFPKVFPKEPNEEERGALALLDRYQKLENGYAIEQSTRPQTLGYGLADSPVGQAMWIYEKFWAWTDCHDDPESVLTRDEMLDDITLYWLTNSAASSARLYWESFGKLPRFVTDLPTGFSRFPKEIFRAPRHWAAETFTNIVHWNDLERGGHFAALEQPEIFVREVRDCFRPLR